jgi:arginyl-tRNA synthetase
VAALRAAAARGELGALGQDQIPAEVSIDRPKNREHGDYATNIALQAFRHGALPISW